MIREATVYDVFFFSICADDLQAIQAKVVQVFLDGTTCPVVGDEFPLIDVGRAHEQVVTSGAHGKIVLRVSS